MPFMLTVSARTRTLFSGLLIFSLISACQKSDGVSERDLDRLLTRFANQAALAELCADPETIMFQNKLEQKIDASRFSKERKQQLKDVYEEKRQYSLKTSQGERSKTDCNILLQGYRQSKVWDDEWYL